MTTAPLTAADLRTRYEAGERDFRDADLSDADLRRANLSDADLRRANLSGADLSGADLSDANLRRANLSDANLSDANLSDADLSGAKGLLDPMEWIAEHFERDTLGIIVFKTFNSNYRPPDTWKIEAGAILTEIVNPSPQNDCACGINVATLAWVQQNVGGGPIWKCRIRFEWLIGAVVPYHTGGKFRTSRLELLEELAGESEVRHG